MWERGCGREAATKIGPADSAGPDATKSGQLDRLLVGSGPGVGPRCQEKPRQGGQHWPGWRPRVAMPLVAQLWRQLVDLFENTRMSLSLA